MLHYITAINKVTDQYEILCRFNDGKQKSISLLPLISQFPKTEIFRQLLDKQYFKTVGLDSYGTLTWDNGVDFCPDVLYQLGKEIN